ncbi:hypothetical protein N0V82_006175 [Gnomoniopsis sp. IMI 355080]|nr:hypothetical protein N0V82_006175 [Gnomoniopsis sp. IMI 355080]
MGRPPGSKNRPRDAAAAPRPPGRPRGRPPGRPRRDSNSTVASIDLGEIPYLDETTVLKPLQSDELDDNLWPNFVLTDAVVYRRTKDGKPGEIANLCNVDLEGPFIIQGRLDVDLSDDHQAKALRNYTQKNAYIQISSNVTYSIGCIGWDLVTVWSAGKSGWFEILPAPKYQAMHDTVLEGITIYYLVQRVYEQARNRAGKGKRHKALQMPIEKLLLGVRTANNLQLDNTLTFIKYASKVGDGVTLSEAKGRCQKHAPFLLAHFARDPLDATEDGRCRWDSTSFHKWLTAENQDLCKQLADAANKRPPAPEPVPRQPSPQSDTTDSKSEVHKLLRAPAAESSRAKRSRERATRLSQEADVEMKDAPSAKEPQRIETPVHPPIPISMRPAPGSVSSAAAVASMPSTPALQKTDDAAPSDPIQSFLDLLEEILEEQGGDPKKLRHTTIHVQMYQKCSTQYGVPQEVSQYYAKQLAASLPSKWYGSPYFAWLKEERDKPWRPASGLTAEAVARQLKRRKKMSRGKPRAAETNSVSTPPSTHMGKRLPATPRTGGLTLKRSRPDYFDDGDGGRASKYPKASSQFASEDEDESEDEEVDDSSEDAPANPYTSSTTPVPLPKIAKETVPVVVRAQKIPTLSPTGPNGTWRCEEDGCDHIIRAAEEPEGKRLIEEHFQDHANRTEKINLALTESTRGHLPINHLLEKIRGMGESAKRQEQGADGVYPEPIKRRLII